MSDAIHTLPLNDLVEHETSPECVCGPECVPVERDDGSFGWLYSHHSLDGREQRESDPLAPSEDTSDES